MPGRGLDSPQPLQLPMSIIIHRQLMGLYVSVLEHGNECDTLRDFISANILPIVLAQWQGNRQISDGCGFDSRRQATVPHPLGHWVGDTFNKVSFRIRADFPDINLEKGAIKWHLL